MTTANGYVDRWEKTLRVLVWKHEDYFIAQCLEYDIAVQAKTLPEIKDRLQQTIFAFIQLANHYGHEPFSTLNKAPSSYTHQWEEVSKDRDRIISYELPRGSILNVDTPQRAELALSF